MSEKQKRRRGPDQSARAIEEQQLARASFSVRWPFPNGDDSPGFRENGAGNKVVSGSTAVNRTAGGMLQMAKDSAPAGS